MDGWSGWKNIKKPHSNQIYNVKRKWFWSGLQCEKKVISSVKGKWLDLKIYIRFEVHTTHSHASTSLTSILFFESCIFFFSNQFKELLPFFLFSNWFKSTIRMFSIFFLTATIFKGKTLSEEWKTKGVNLQKNMEERQPLKVYIAPTTRFHFYFLFL